MAENTTTTEIFEEASAEDESRKLSLCAYESRAKKHGSNRVKKRQFQDI